MNLRNKAGRIMAGIIGAAGLAYPACAAVCPKGHGACPYPGKCFLYTDADTNSICDYTRSTASGSPPGSGVASSTTTATSATTSAVQADAGTSAASSVTVQAGSGTGIIQQSAVLIGIALFIIIGAALFCVLRSGRFGPGLSKTGPALALSALISLGIAEIATCLMMGDAALASASYFAALYMLAGTVLTAYLWKSGAMTRETITAVAVISVAFGFALTALIMPAEFYGLAGVLAGSRTITFGIIAILAALALTVIAGRTFCGHICPVGSIQELAYGVPVKKAEIGKTRILEGIRLAVAGAAVIAAAYAVDLVSFTGAYDFFSLTVSVWFVIFVILLLIAMTVYRPVCRAICPFGLLFSLAAQFSRFRLGRTGACISCRKCEKTCPAGVAGKDDPKRECYLCGRCTDSCPAEGALVYRKRD